MSIATIPAKQTIALRETFGIRFREQQPVSAKPGIYKVAILTEGPGNPRDKHFYTAAAIKRAPAIFEGLAAFADHPDAIEEEARPERSIKDLVGWYQHVEALPDERSGKMQLVGNLVTVGGSSLQWVRDLLDAALLKKQNDPSASELVGFSINATGVTSPISVGGEEWHGVEEFVEAKSVDIVTQAGAGGRVVARALKEAMYEKVREGQMQAIQIKRAVHHLRSRNDPSLTPVIRALDKAYLDLTHEKPAGGADMATETEARRKANENEGGEARRKPASEKEKEKEVEGGMASEIEARVKALEDEARARTAAETEDEKSEGEGGEDEAEDMSFADWAGGDDAAGADDEEPPEKKKPDTLTTMERRLRAIEERLGLAASEDEDEAAEDEADDDEPPEKPDDAAVQAAEDEGSEEESEGRRKMTEFTPAILAKGKARRKATESKQPEKKPEPPLKMPATLRESLAREIYAQTIASNPKATKRERRLAREVAVLRARLSEITEVNEARTILREAGIPRAAWDFVLEDLVGRPLKEKRRLVESFRAAMLARMRGAEEDQDVRQTPGSGETKRAPADLTQVLADEDVPIAKGVQ